MQSINVCICIYDAWYALKNILVKVNEYAYDGVHGYVALLAFYDYILI